MIIALLTNGIWPDKIGGIEMHSFNIAKYFTRKNVYVDLYFIQSKTSHVEWENYFSKEELEFLKLIPIVYEFQYSFPGHYIYESYLISKKIYSAFENSTKKYDIIYSQGFTGWFFYKKKLGIPIVVNFHGLNMFQPTPTNFDRLVSYILRPFVKYNLSKADYVQSLGGELTDILISIGIKRNKIFECGIGIGDDWFTNTTIKIKDKISYLFVGRNDRLKGINELNIALEKFKDDPFKMFTIVGPIPKKILSNNIQYVGEIKDSNILKSIYDESNFLILASWSEGMPTVILEAMSRSIPVLSTNVGAVSNLVNEKNGFLFKPNSSDELIMAIQKSSDLKANEYDILRINAFNDIKNNYEWSEVASRMISFFESIRSTK